MNANIKAILAPEPVSHNLTGQKLGPKGQQTRERIVQAMLALCADPQCPPVTLTSVAKAAGVGLSNLYLYFPDMPRLLMAALGRVMEAEEDSYLHLLRRRWPDETLQQSCREFLTAHNRFWRQHGRILHMRNAMADAQDLRIIEFRTAVSEVLIELLIRQMEDRHPLETSPCRLTAVVLLTGIERIATVVTSPSYIIVTGELDAAGRAELVRKTIEAEAESVSLTIAHKRGQIESGELKPA